MKHFASPEFWFHYRLLPEAIQNLTAADKNFTLLKENPRHPSLRLNEGRPYFGPFEWESATVHSVRCARKESSGPGLVRTPITIP